MAEIPLQPDDKPNIYDFGYSKSLNRTVPGIQSPMVYDVLDATQAQNVSYGVTLAGSGNSVIIYDPTQGIWVGHALFAQAPFAVNMNGDLRANVATVQNRFFDITTGTIGNLAPNNQTIDTVTAHGLGRTPKIVTISCDVVAAGSTNSQKGVGSVSYNASGTNVGGFSVKVDNVGALGSSNIVFATNADISATGTGGTNATVTASVLSIGATNFTFRVVATGTGACQVNNINWRVEG